MYSLRNPIEMILDEMAGMDIAAPHMAPTRLHIGPGRKTLDRYHKPGGRYDGATLRRLRAERGVGRPPRREYR